MILFLTITLTFLFDKDDEIKVDVPSIQSAAQHIGLGNFLQSISEAEHLNAIFKLNIDLTNVRKFAAKIRKLEVARVLRNQLDQALNRGLLGL